MLHALKQIVH